VSVPHGTTTSYAYGCRCDECRNANRLRQIEWREGRRKKNDVTNVVRPVNPLDLLRPDWVVDAACRGATDLFFAERGDSVAIREAKRICTTCPVSELCLEYGEMEQYGIWGGLAVRERRALRTTERPPAECGTDSGYYRHRRRNEDACDACKAAHTAVTVAYNRGARRSRTFKQEAS